jgi:5-methylcytosine-specific restriction endonuclease McrA
MGRDVGCLVCGIDDRRLQVHHRKPRKMGGRADRLRTNAPSNLITLCEPHHTWVESHRKQAYDTGLLVREHDDPSRIPLRHALYGPVFLHDDGSIEPVPHLEAS